MMKNFSTSKRLLTPVAPVLMAVATLLTPACDRMDSAKDVIADEPSLSRNQMTGVVSSEGVAQMLARLPLTIDHVREVHDGVLSSSCNGYDEEYPFSILFSSPGSGVGDEFLPTRAGGGYSMPLSSLILSSQECLPGTRSTDFAQDLSESGLQIYWPYSEDWDGKTMPVITFDPADASFAPYAVKLDDGSNIGYLREQLPNGSWIVKEVVVDEDYARNNPVWVVNHNEDSSYMTPQMLEALYPEMAAAPSTRSGVDCRTLVLKEFKAHRNYDPWFAGGSEFFVKCGALNGFTAKTEEEIKLYTPSVTDLMINVKRKQVGKTVRFNTVIVSEWTPQLEECAFLIIEDDGGKQTSWKANGLVKIKSRSYGFEVEIPFRRNDDLVWRGKLSSGYFEKYNGKPNRFGDVSVTFSFL